MKILAIHNFHRTGSASGDDQVFKSETALLREHGNTVAEYTVKNDEFDNVGIFGKILSAFGMMWSFKNYKAVKRLIAAEKPDVVHIHTFFPLLSPSVLYAVKRSNTKLVATLHDTRFICPCATSLRDGKLCNECGDGKYFRMCKYGCFKKSKLQSLLVAIIFKYHRIRKSFYKTIDKYICLNDNQIQLLLDVGFDRNKIVKKYNFVPEHLPQSAVDNAENADVFADLPSRYAVYYGRIGEEKGIDILKKAWDKIADIPLVVMGGGPLEDDFVKWAKSHANVHFLGYTQHDKCLSIVQSAEFVVFPSIWYEGCSMVEIEAESLGKAIVATNLGFSAEAIQNGYNGEKFELNDVDGFAKAVYDLWDNPEKCKQMGLNARKDYVAKYLPEDNYKKLIEIYKS